MAGKGFIIWSLILNVVLLGQVDVSGSSMVTLNGNGYENLLINLDVNQDTDCLNVLYHLEELLAAASQQWHTATSQWLHWQHVQVLIPPSWNNSLCLGATNRTRTVTRATWARPHEADMQISSGLHPLLGTMPWTEQYGGCGQPGKQIHFTVNFLTQAEDVTLKAKRLVQQWARYRYGVFDEIGYAHDERYPLTYQEGLTTMPTTCNNASTSGNNTVEENVASNVVTSIMSSPLDSQVAHFCDASTHNKAAPTKHNILCEEKSMWEVFMAHPDFKLQRNRGGKELPWLDEEDVISSTESTKEELESVTEISDPESSLFVPKIEYVIADVTRYVIILDRTKSMASNNRWSIIRRSLVRFIHALPDGSELCVISMGHEASLALPLTVVTAGNRDGLVGRIPRRPLTSSDMCLTCAFKMARQVLQESTPCCAGQIVLVTGSSSYPDQFASLADSIVSKRSPLSVSVIAYPSHTTFPELSRLAGENGLAMAVSERNTSAALTQAHLTQALLQILRMDQLPLHQVYEQIHWSFEGLEASGAFLIEEGLGANTLVTAHCYDEGDVEALEVTSPSGKVFDLPLVTDGLLYLRLPGVAEAGIWKYKLKFYQLIKNGPAAVVMEVLTEPDTKESTIFASIWTNVGTEAVNASQTPIILYADVRKGQFPVMSARVTAIVTRPGSAEPEVRVPLYDRGSGDPDITHGDGIYSGYFTHVASPGSYSIHLKVTDGDGAAMLPQINSHYEANCCGNRMPYKKIRYTPPFTRIVTGPALVIKEGLNLTTQVDIYPPSRVTDLRITNVSNATSQIELVWSAPGGDFDRGSAASYEIRCFTDRSALTPTNFQSQGILIHSTPLIPAEIGTRQHVIVDVPWPNQIFYYALVAIDSANNRGKVSNIVSTYIYEAPPTTTLPPTPPPSDFNNTTDTESRQLLPAHYFWFGLQETELYALVGGVIGTVLILLLVTIVVCLRSSKNRQQRLEENVKTEPQTVSKPTATLYDDKAWFSTLPRDGSTAHENADNKDYMLDDNVQHMSLPRFMKSNSYRHVLTNGSIIITKDGHNGSSGNVMVDGTSLSSKPSVASEDTGIESSADERGDSRDSADHEPPMLPPLPVTSSALSYMPSHEAYVYHNTTPTDPNLGIPLTNNWPYSGTRRTSAMSTPVPPYDTGSINNRRLPVSYSFREQPSFSTESEHQPVPMSAGNGTGPAKKKRHISFV